MWLRALRKLHVRVRVHIPHPSRCGQCLRALNPDLHYDQHRLPQYYFGIKEAIAYGRRMSRGAPTIPHLWVTDLVGDLEPVNIVLADDVYDVVAREFELDHPLPADLVRRLEAQFPRLRENWARKRVIRTYVHPAVQLIVYIGPVENGSSRSRLLGLSGRCCMCCREWLRHCNTVGWRVSGSSDRDVPCPSWALPSSTWPSGLDVDGDDDGGDQADEALDYAAEERLSTGERGGARVSEWVPGHCIRRKRTYGYSPFDEAL